MNHCIVGLCIYPDSMGHQALDLPVETWEHIIWLIPDSSDAKERWQCKHRSTFLACALVCKTWTLLARCRLLSLYFPKGKVKITNTDTIIDLIPIFQSPLRTLDPAFIRTLWFMPYTNPIFEGRAGHILNLTVLLLLDVSLFPSLQNLKFTKTLLSNGNIPISLPFSPTSVLSQIKSLTIFPPSDTPFENGILTIQLCPSVEKVKLWHNFDEDPNRDLYKARRPPKSLRKLILDMPTLREMAKWLMRCQPAHTTISSLEIRDFAWDDDVECPDLRKLLDRVGPNLEEFTLDVPHEFGLQVGPGMYISTISRGCGPEPLTITLVQMIIQLVIPAAHSPKPQKMFDSSD